MAPEEIVRIRESLRFSHSDLSSVMGVHYMTVSKWERAITTPSDYQEALLMRFDRSRFKSTAKQTLVSKGAIAALADLLSESI